MPLNGKQFGCGHTPKFLQGAGPAKMLVGELPKPAVLRDKLSQSPGALHRNLRPVTIVPGPYSHACLLCRADDQDRKSTRLNSSHIEESRMPSSA